MCCICYDGICVRFISEYWPLLYYSPMGTLLKLSLVFAVYVVCFILSHFTISLSTSRYLFFFLSRSISQWTSSARYEHNWLWWQWAELSYVCMYACWNNLFIISFIRTDSRLWFVRAIYLWDTRKCVWHHVAHCVVMRTINKLHSCFHHILCMRVACEPIELHYIYVYIVLMCVSNSFTFRMVFDCVSNCLTQTINIMQFSNNIILSVKTTFHFVATLWQCISTKSQLNKLMAQSLLYISIVFHCSFGGSFFFYLSRIPEVCVFLCANKKKKVERTHKWNDTKERKRVETEKAGKIPLER